MIRIYMLNIETIHLPLEICAYLQAFPGWRLHPLVPLVMSCLLLPVWGWYTFLFSLGDFSAGDYGVSGAWFGLSIIKTVIATVIIILYIVYLGFAAMAVHQWRGRSGRRRGTARVVDDHAHPEDVETKAARDSESAAPLTHSGGQTLKA
jgi:uncharacterized membrane protein